MSKVKLYAIAIAILAGLAVLDMLSIIKLGAGMHLIAVLAILCAFNLLNARNEQEISDG